ncbi:cytochrome P450 [Telmatospirillum sp. J64-1]|uniref:cytochrome P450 n=1 Tax=Telmatospirillum sp. J64-1 TaxID=2502183 RepID=UPI00115F17DB|nr:cytochrome P450 [Telmatospirillum sp. J64-1]
MADETAGTMETLPKASAWDTLAALAEIFVPTLSKGVIIRRPKVTKLAERMDLNRRAVRRMQKLRAKYGEGPLLMSLAGRTHALILSPEHVHRVLEETPEPFSPASSEKRAALAHLEPKASLISEGPKRTERKNFNEEVLEARKDVHPLADHFATVVEQEMTVLLEAARDQGELTWDLFAQAWYAMVRRVVLGDSARDDHDLTDMLAKLRGAANWAFMHPGHDKVLDSFHQRVDEYLERAEPGTLAAVIARTPKTADTAPSHQIAHWMFAFDPGGMATIRALALIVTHPEQGERAYGEIAELWSQGKKNLPFLRACILESLRLWSTTPVVLRESRQDTLWPMGKMEKDTSIVIFAPFFHRDDQNLAYADRFYPDLWLQGQREGGWPLIPFSGGSGICPARNLVPMLGSMVLATLLQGRRFALKDPAKLDPAQPIPGSLDNYTLRFLVQEGGQARERDLPSQ